MKKTIFSTVLFLMVTAAAFAGGFEGTWTSKVKGQDGVDMDLIFVFKMESEKLTGVIKTPNGDKPLSNAKIDGKILTFEIAFGEMTMKHVCTMKDDDTFSAKVEGSPMGDTEMIFKRQK